MRSGNLAIPVLWILGRDPMRRQVSVDEDYPPYQRIPRHEVRVRRSIHWRPVQLCLMEKGP